MNKMVDITPIVVVVHATLSPSSPPSVTKSVSVGEVSVRAEITSMPNSLEKETLLSIKVPLKEKMIRSINDDVDVSVETMNEAVVVDDNDTNLLSSNGIPNLQLAMENEADQNSSGVEALPFGSPSSPLILVANPNGDRIIKNNNKCPICRKDFCDTAYLKKHVKIHENGSLGCEDCEAMYKNKTSLTKHKVAMHGFELARDQSQWGKQQKKMTKNN